MALAKIKVDIETFGYDNDTLWGFRFFAVDRVHAHINFNSKAEAFAAGNKYLTKILRARPRKPVVEVTTKEMWDYEYQAKHPTDTVILASDSLANLQRGIKARRWKVASITTSIGIMSYGQNGVNEYPYVPDYRSRS